MCVARLCVTPVCCVTPGMRFILGLNFLSGDVGLAKAQMAKAREQLPQGSLISFEVGNEVGGWQGPCGAGRGDGVGCVSLTPASRLPTPTAPLCPTLTQHPPLTLDPPTPPPAAQLPSPSCPPPPTANPPTPMAHHHSRSPLTHPASLCLTLAPSLVPPAAQLLLQ